MTSIRLALLTDIEAIQKVANESWHDTYKGMIPPETQRSFLDYAYSSEMLTKRINSGNFYVGIKDGEVVAFLNYSNPRENNIVYLLAFYVCPSHQRKGLGSRLFSKMIDNLEHNANIICEVETDNKIGKSFYNAKGFIELSQYEDDFLGYKLSTTKMLFARN